MTRSENFQQMRERHVKEVQRLQKNCKHEHISDFMRPGSPSYFCYKHCLFCGKFMEGEYFYALPLKIQREINAKGD